MVMTMFKNRLETGRRNLVGLKMKEYRLKLRNSPSQRAFAELLQMSGLDVDKNAVQRMESGERFITDIELKVLAEVLGVTYEDLLD